MPVPVPVPGRGKKPKKAQRRVRACPNVRPRASCGSSIMEDAGSKEDKKKRWRDDKYTVGGGAELGSHAGL